MKKVLLFLAVAAFIVLTSSCSSLALFGNGGMVYEGTVSPFAVTSNTFNSNNMKVGRANHVSVLGLVAVGDGGINAAAKNGGITKISAVDVEKTSILGLFTKKETIVYGE